MPYTFRRSKARMGREGAMASDVEKWARIVCEYDAAMISGERVFVDDPDICQAARIALAVAEWEEYLTSLAPERRPGGTTVVRAIMRGEGPGHLPPEESNG